MVGQLHSSNILADSSWGCQGDASEHSLFTSLSGCESQENKRRKVSRFMVRCYRGVACGKAKLFRFRWFVLTESDEAIKLGIDFGTEFNKFVVWLRYRCRDFQYVVVEHRQGDKQRRNWHILSYGSDRLPVLAMREYWLRHFKSTVTGMAEVRDIDKAVRYLAGYLGSGDKFVRSWSSQGWVFRGWLGWSKWYRKNFSPHEYPSAESITSLSLMSPAEREGIVLVPLMTAESSKKKQVIRGQFKGETSWSMERRRLYEWGYHHLRKDEYVSS